MYIPSKRLKAYELKLVAPCHKQEFKKLVLGLLAYSPPKRLDASEPKLVAPCLKQEIQKLVVGLLMSKCTCS